MKLHYFICLIWMTFAMTSIELQAGEVSVTDFGARPNDGLNDAWKSRACLTPEGKAVVTP